MINIEDSFSRDTINSFILGSKIFQDALKKMRVKDDKIIYELNVALPTQSFERNLDTTQQCKNFYEQVYNIISSAGVFYVEFTNNPLQLSHIVSFFSRDNQKFVYVIQSFPLLSYQPKSEIMYIERGEVIIPACDVIRINDVKRIFMAQFFYLRIEIVNILDLLIKITQKKCF